MFLVAALNDLDILGADVQNAYINAKTKEKVYTTAGPEFGSNQGRPAIIVRALYGLKSSGARWRTTLHLSSVSLVSLAQRLTLTFGCARLKNHVASSIGNIFCAMLMTSLLSAMGIMIPL